MAQRAAALQQFSINFAGDQQRRKHRLPVQPDRRIEQTVPADNALTFMPEQSTITTNIQMTLKMAQIKALATGRTTQRDHVPVEQPRIAFKINRRRQFSLRGAVDDGLLR